jgi:hypothetical protein
VLAETPVRFFLGGTIVSLFALIGTVLRPPSFAGIFGSAPSVAIASLALAFAKDGRVYAATESRSMLVGAIGLVAYSGSCVWAINRPGFPVWGAAAICWLTWFAVTAWACGLFAAGRTSPASIAGPLGRRGLLSI